MSVASYRGSLLAAIPLGVAVGAGLAVSVYLTANPDYRAQGGLAAFSILVGTGALAGGATAVVATVGAAIAISISGRTREPASGVPVVAGAVGAASGAAALWLGVGTVNAVVPPGGASWFGMAALLAFVAAGIAAGLAALVLRRVPRTSASPEPSSASSPADRAR